MSVESVLRRLRCERGFTIEGTAKAVGLSRSGYQQIEVGTRSVDEDTAIRIAKYFDVPLADLFMPKNYSVRLAVAS